MTIYILAALLAGAPKQTRLTRQFIKAKQPLLSLYNPSFLLIRAMKSSHQTYLS